MTSKFGITVNNSGYIGNAAPKALAPLAMPSIDLSEIAANHDAAQPYEQVTSAQVADYRRKVSRTTVQTNSTPPKSAQLVYLDMPKQ